MTPDDLGGMTPDDLSAALDQLAKDAQRSPYDGIAGSLGGLSGALGGLGQAQAPDMQALMQANLQRVSQELAEPLTKYGSRFPAARDPIDVEYERIIAEIEARKRREEREPILRALALCAIVLLLVLGLWLGLRRVLPKPPAVVSALPRVDVLQFYEAGQHHDDRGGDAVAVAPYFELGNERWNSAPHSDVVQGWRRRVPHYDPRILGWSYTPRFDSYGSQEACTLDACTAERR